MKLKLSIMFIVVFFVATLIFYVRWQMKFESKVWMESGRVVKYRMALYMENEKILNNKTKEEVVGLLGSPDVETANSLFFYVDQPFGYKDGFTVLFDQGKVSGSYVHD